MINLETISNRFGGIVAATQLLSAGQQTPLQFVFVSLQLNHAGEFRAGFREHFAHGFRLHHRARKTVQQSALVAIGLR